jgi:hypothetical protein
MDYMNDLMDDWGFEFRQFFEQYGAPAIWRSNRKDIDSETGNAIYEYYDKPIKIIYNVTNPGGIMQTKNARLPADKVKVAALEELQNDDILVIDGVHWLVENSNTTLKYNNPDKMIYTFATLKKKVDSSGSQY